jgi:hypothetical protein
MRQEEVHVKQFWKVWDGRIGAAIRWVFALIGLVVLGSEPYKVVRLAFATLIGVGIGWRARRRSEAKPRRLRTTKFGRAMAGIRHFLVGNGEKLE